MSISGQEWNEFIIKQSCSFLQSWEWGVFQENVGKKVFRVEVPGMRGQVFLHKLAPGLSYLYMPRGPVGDEKNFPEWLEKTKGAAEHSDAAFIRIEPPKQFPVSSFQFRSTGRAIQPRQNLVISLQETEDQVLAAMHEKTRYNIRLAERKGVRVRGIEYGPQNTDTFLSLLKSTAAEQKLKIYSDGYYRKMLEVFGSEGGTRGTLFFAYYQEKPIAAAFCVGFGRRLTYLHGGSSRENKNVMAPQLLHWEIMRWAKAQGYNEYDMGGIDDERWPGLTRFKRGFGGDVEKFPGAFELPMKPFHYQLYRFVRTVVKR